MKDKVRSLRDAVIKHSKFVFPVIVIAAVAITVSLALGAGKAEEELAQSLAEEETETAMTEEVAFHRVIPEVELERNEDSALYTLIATYYNALANGDVATIQSISNYVEDTEIIRIQELSKYIESYPLIEIYTKPGAEENSYVAYVYTQVTFDGYTDLVPGLMTFYVCADEDGKLYLNEGETAEDVLDYIKTISLQDDVVELNNKVNVEYNDLMLSNTKLFDYISELEREVSKATGEALAAQVSEDNGTQQSAEGDDSQTEGQQPSAEPVQAQASSGAVYATATTTVNVRSSDSELADKLGKITGGSRVQVTEQRANGWSKIVYEGKDGYVKSEYLQTASTDGNTDEVSVSGKKATTNVNLRKEASETAEKICVVVGGDTLEVLSEANGWSQVKYKGMVGFVKSEFLQ